MHRLVAALFAITAMSCAPQQDCSLYSGSFASYLMCRMAQRSEAEEQVTQRDVVQELTERAEGGEAQAQYFLGKYFEPIDPKKSWRWNCVAAMQGHRIAQSRMGWMYRWGTEPVPKDPVRAYMWYVLAANDEDARLVALREKFAQTLTPSQVIAGASRAEEWRPGSCEIPI